MCCERRQNAGANDSAVWQRLMALTVCQREITATWLSFSLARSLSLAPFLPLSLTSWRVDPFSWPRWSRHHCLSLALTLTEDMSHWTRQGADRWGPLRTYTHTHTHTHTHTQRLKQAAHTDTHRHTHTHRALGFQTCNRHVLLKLNSTMCFALHAKCYNTVCIYIYIYIYIYA